MSRTSPGIRTERLAIASAGDITPGAGEARRAAIATATRDWVTGLFVEAVGDTKGVALAAVGSLARGLSGPLSDLDLVLVHDGYSIPETRLSELAERLWYPIWDSGLALDHAVRSTDQCRSVAHDDLSAAVGMLDLTCIAGDADLVATVRAAVARDWRALARTRLPQFVDSVRARHERHGVISQQVEPNLKEGRGGLRDVTVLRAITRAWLADHSHGAVEPAIGRLLDVRDAMQVSTGRGRDRLLREDHDAVARRLGLAGPDELLMTVSSAARTIAQVVEDTLRRAGQSQRARSLRVGPRQPLMIPLGDGAFVHDGEVVLGSAARVRAGALQPLRVASVAARAGYPLGPRTLTNLAAVPAPSVPWSAQARAALTALLGSGPGLVAVWEGLDGAGVIDRWLPEWAAVRSRPQHNPVHRSTVERHLLETVVHAAELSRDVSRPDLLLLGALLHDIGKVPGEDPADHPRTGAGIADRVLARWGLPDGDRAAVVHLVREHLTLIRITTRRDPQDPATVDAVVDLVDGDLATFDLLRVLTVADARATGPRAWTEWRSGLLDALTSRVRARLTGGGDSGACPAGGAEERTHNR